MPRGGTAFAFDGTGSAKLDGTGRCTPLGISDFALDGTGSSLVLLRFKGTLVLGLVLGTTRLLLVLPTPLVPAEEDDGTSAC